MSSIWPFPVQPQAELPLTGPIQRLEERCPALAQVANVLVDDLIRQLDDHSYIGNDAKSAERRGIVLRLVVHKLGEKL